MCSVRTSRRFAALAAAIIVAFPRPAAAQPVKALVDSQNYVFQAQTVQPLRGPVHQVTTDLYTLKITKHKVISDLPYFGRAYVAPMDPSKGALQFTLTYFSYSVRPGKHGGWNVTIRPKDSKDIQALELNISSAGYASLQVIATNMDAISFNGVVTPPDRH
ncbi:MAG TPA: DUF4251 domain-containing protein [Puia sp.]|nr:DUF4251 domain-containing protein [Puia sp.]